MTCEEALKLIREHTDYGGSVDQHALAVVISGTAPTTGSAPEERNFEAYRRGVREAFDLANTIRAKPYGRNAEETCAYIVRSLAELANGGEISTAAATGSAPVALTEDEKVEILDWVSACQSAYHIDSTQGHRFGGLGSNLEENRDALIEFVESIVAQRALLTEPAK